MRTAKARAAAQAESRRKAASTRARSKNDKAIDKQADKARLEQLEAEAQALEEREAALTAKDEAQRLQDAATAKKAGRKKK